ncbi:MAG: 50S ribosomal protein L22 [Candidatus Anstonellales archaeon]
MYSWKPENVEFAAKARVEGVDASFKDLVEVCGNIRRMKASDALSFLEKAADGKVAVLYRSNNKHLGHRKELGGKKGRYPKKAAKIVLKVLKNALNNAMQKGLLEENLFVAHACANKKFTYPRLQPKGRRTRHDYETARVEIILIEKGAEKKIKEEAKEKKEEKKEEKEMKKEGKAGKEKQEKKQKEEKEKKTSGVE